MPAPPFFILDLRSAPTGCYGESLMTRVPRRLAILTDGLFNVHYAKTALGVLRYSPDRVVAMIDRDHAGKDCADVVGVGRGVPVVASVEEALAYGPDTLLIGIAPRGGGLPDEWRPWLLTALRAGLHLESGLHSFLGDDPDLARIASQHGAAIRDVRRAPPERRVAVDTRHRRGSRTILTVGSDCAVGKMSAALEIERLARGSGATSTFVATGQTGIMIWGSGAPVDALVGDFMAGEVERLTVAACEAHDLVFVEGQGSLLHPGYSGVTLALLHGCRADALVLCHIAGLTHIDGYTVPVPPLRDVAAIYESAAAWPRSGRRVPVVGIALATFRLGESAARGAITALREDTGLPVADPVRFGAAPLLDAVLAAPCADE
ncbi:MAG: DUF1611 domain-containing protein [Chloroflexota bacterium]